MVTRKRKPQGRWQKTTGKDEKQWSNGKDKGDQKQEVVVSQQEVHTVVGKLWTAVCFLTDPGSVWVQVCAGVTPLTRLFTMFSFRTVNKVQLSNRWRRFSFQTKRRRPRPVPRLDWHAAGSDPTCGFSLSGFLMQSEDFTASRLDLWPRLVPDQGSGSVIRESSPLVSTLELIQNLRHKEKAPN